ncbi:MAG TPA: endolytic transglycosylase MltG [Polyangiaceae bacterium]|nr:endolytic transglycosylase MltG [Polyangiaceae bacterium]
MPSRPPGRSSGVGWAALVFALCLVALGGLYLAFVVGYGSSGGPGLGREVDLDWPPDLDAASAADRLEAAGLVSDASTFALYLRLTGGLSNLRAGRHLLTDDLSPRALVRRMQRTQVQERAKVAVPEGFTRFDIGKRLQSARVCSARAFIEATHDDALLSAIHIPAETAEGFLFPATYEFSLDSEPAQIVTRMKAEFDKRFDRLLHDNPQGTENLRARLGWGPLEIVTLASIVEKEAGVDDERPVIASVFLNRLQDPAFVPKRLQSDPTSVYGCLAMPERIGSCRNFTGKPTPELNADDTNPYTTYRHEGLPPGPIASPGEKSLAAVLAPAESRYLYFVARGEGRHAFSETYAQHNEAIHRARAAQP